VIFDVENSSRAEHVSRMLEHLGLGALDRNTRLSAVGNWGVIGQETARLLARYGAELVHSAPAFGVKDWSDLRIAVAAGMWLARARPGDILEVITDDQAFDAVGDVAASRGVIFHRLSYRGLVGAQMIAPVESASRRRGRRGRRGRGPAGHRHASVHAAPHDELLAVIHELAARSPDGSMTLDALSNTLQARGFRRPAGSPRLITRLRLLKDVDVSTNGTVRLLTPAGRS
jgi:hypothetical protein